MVNCAFEYKEGSTHPYFKNKIDLQPNVPQLQEAPFSVGDTLYVEGAKDIKLNGEEIA